MADFGRVDEGASDLALLTGVVAEAGGVGEAGFNDGGLAAEVAAILGAFALKSGEEDLGGDGLPEGIGVVAAVVLGDLLLVLEEEEGGDVASATDADELGGAGELDVSGLVVDAGGESAVGANEGLLGESEEDAQDVREAFGLLDGDDDEDGDAGAAQVGEVDDAAAGGDFAWGGKGEDALDFGGAKFVEHGEGGDLNGGGGLGVEVAVGAPGVGEETVDGVGLGAAFEEEGVEVGLASGGVVSGEEAVEVGDGGIGELVGEIGENEESALDELGGGVAEEAIVAFGLLAAAYQGGNLLGDGDVGGADSDQVDGVGEVGTGEVDTMDVGEIAGGGGEDFALDVEAENAAGHFGPGADDAYDEGGGLAGAGLGDEGDAGAGDLEGKGEPVAVSEAGEGDGEGEGGVKAVKEEAVQVGGFAPEGGAVGFLAGAWGIGELDVVEIGAHADDDEDGEDEGAGEPQVWGEGRPVEGEKAQDEGAAGAGEGKEGLGGVLEETVQSGGSGEVLFKGGSRQIEPCVEGAGAQPEGVLGEDETKIFQFCEHRREVGSGIRVCRGGRRT